MKNVLLFTSLKANDPNLDSYKEWSLKTWQYYADRNNLELFILDVPLFDTELMRPTWQRWYVYDLLEANNIEYNQVALIDIDTMIRWDAPNLFEVAGDNYAGVIDDLGIEWIYNSINGYKFLFPDVDLRWYSYINNGVLILPSKKGKEFCNIVNNFYLEHQEILRELQHRTLKKGTDQTPVNYLALSFFKKNIVYLPKIYNMGHMYKTDVFIDNIYIKCSYIWHFNGIPRDRRDFYMKNTWEVIKHNYV